MQLDKLLTLNFQRNVGNADRVFRLLSGLALAASGWWLALPTWLAWAMTVVGAMWFATGVLSKCSIYYVLGYSTCPLQNSDRARRQLP